VRVVVLVVGATVKHTRSDVDVGATSTEPEQTVQGKQVIPPLVE
jgi:hypothetical protein